MIVADELPPQLQHEMHYYDSFGRPCRDPQPQLLRTAMPLTLFDAVPVLTFSEFVVDYLSPQNGDILGKVCKQETSKCVQMDDSIAYMIKFNGALNTYHDTRRWWFKYIYDFIYLTLVIEVNLVLRECKNKKSVALQKVFLSRALKRFAHVREIEVLKVFDDFLDNHIAQFLKLNE